MRTRMQLAAAAIVAGATFAGAAGSASAVESPPDSEPPVEMSAAAARPVTIVDAAGVQLATIAVDSVEENWTDHGPVWSPDAGDEFLRVLVSVESLVSRGTFEVSTYQFVVQDDAGFLSAARTVLSTAQYDDDVQPLENVELAGGETVQLELTFEVVSGTTPVQLFFEAAHDQLVTIVELA